MSEIIDNRNYRKSELKKIIKRLHEGASVEEVQEDFNRLNRNVTATEITEMEQELVNEGLPVEQIQKLCDVHANVFKGSIEQIHTTEESRPEFEIGHPIYTMRLENRKIEDLIERILNKLDIFVESGNDADAETFKNEFNKLMEIDKHYKRKENLIFPYLEKNNVTAPPQVMWGVDDEIRDEIKRLSSLFDTAGISGLNESIRELLIKINDMVFKEEEILFPMTLELFTHENWADIEKSSEDFGFSYLDKVKRWNPAVMTFSFGDGDDKKEEVSSEILRIMKDSDTLVDFDAGAMSSKELNAIFNTLPVDITFVGADNKVKYFTQGKERIFDRSPTIIGREVKYCHPPKSVHIVEAIVEDLRSGKIDNEDFWIRMGDAFVYIRYFAVRDKNGEYLGTIEVSQNIKNITELEGEKRLRDME